MEASFFIQTFGCQMNVRDSAWLHAALQKRNLAPASLEQAGFVILNTCSVREKPERKVVEAIRRIHAQRGGEASCAIVVLGCVAQQMGKGLFEISPLVRIVAGSDGLALVPDKILKLLDNQGSKFCLDGFEDLYPERELTSEIVLSGSAFVNIMQGCDNFCSYCIVPFTRGRQKSRKSADVERECRLFLERGATEITLLGQNVNAFGKDSGDMPFPDLLERLLKLPGLRRLRFTSAHPTDMDARTVSLFGEYDALCPRLHLPLQAGSDEVLRRMRRRYTRAQYLELVGRLRKAKADLALSTDLIVGFPGETEKDFQDTLEMMRECGFMSSFSFCYSDRPGTRASLMPDKTPQAIMADRLQRLQSLQDELGGKWLQERVGEIAEVLLEGPAARQAEGSKAWQGRDIFGMTVNVPLSEGKPGSYRMVRIVEAKKHSLAAEAMDEMAQTSDPGN